MDWPTAGIVASIILVTLTIGRFVFGGTWSMASRISSIETKAGSIETNVAGVQMDIKRLADMLVAMADMRGDFRVLASRVTNAEQDIRDLQRGEGMILPLSKGAHEVGRG